MKVVCMDNSSGNSRHFEVGKIYEANLNPQLPGIQEGEFYVIRTRPWMIPVDRGIRLDKEGDIWVKKEAFISLEEWREGKLGELGI